MVVGVDFGWVPAKTYTRHILHHDLSRLLPGIDSGEGKTHSQVRLAEIVNRTERPAVYRCVLMHVKK